MFLFILIGILSNFFLFFLLRQLFGQSIQLADGLFVSSILGIFLSIFLYKNVFRKLNVIIFSKRELHLTSLLISVLFLLFSTQSLLNIDRSRSFYIFNWIQCAPKEATSDDIAKTLVSKYGVEAREAFSLRLKEHENRRLIFSTDSKLRLSVPGKILFQSSRILAKAYKLNGWYRSEIWNNSKCVN